MCIFDENLEGWSKEYFESLSGQQKYIIERLFANVPEEGTYSFDIWKLAVVYFFADIHREAVETILEHVETNGEILH